MKKKILIVSTCPFNDDGLTKVILDIYEHLKNDIYFEFATAFGFENKVGEILSNQNVVMHELNKKKQIIKYMSSIRRLVKKNNYDAVYIHGNSAMMFFEAFPCIFCDTEIITHCHNTSSDYKIFHYLIKPFFNLVVDKKIACSTSAANWAYKGENIYIVPNGIDSRKMRFSQKDRVEIRKKLSLSNEIIVGHIGRFNKQKNHKKVVNIFSEFNKIHKNSKLLLIGKGELLNEIKKLIKEKKIESDTIIVERTDYVEKYLSCMDVIILPSLFEGLGIVALEAQANGLPSIVSEKFPNEAKKTSSVRTLSLSENDKTWVELMDELYQMKHGEISNDELYTMDLEKMMTEIKQIIR